MRIVLIAAFFLTALPAFAQQKVTFPSNDQDINNGKASQVGGLLYRPAGNGPFSAIVLLHGCSGLYRSKELLSSRHEDWAQRFHAQGYVVLLTDSFTTRGVRQICSAKDRNIRPDVERPRDAYGALRYLQSLAFVRSDRIGLMGWSHGAMTALWTVAQDASARAGSSKPDFQAAVAFYPGCTQVRNHRPRWSPAIPLLMLLGEKDDWTPAEPCQKLVEREKRSDVVLDLVVYPGAYHDFDAPDTPVRVRKDVATTRSGTATIGTNPKARADAIERVSAWFAHYLKD